MALPFNNRVRVCPVGFLAKDNQASCPTLPPFNSLAQGAGHSREASPQTLQDFALIQRITAHNDEKAWRELLTFYHRPVQQVARQFVRSHAVADDLTMEIFARISRHIGSFRPDYAFSTWLFRVARNYCIDYQRRRRLQTVPLHSLGTDQEGEPRGFDVPDQDLTPYEAVVDQYRAMRLRQVVSQLSPKYEKMVRLRYFQELSYEEIAAVQQLPLGTVKAQLHRCRQLLHELLAPERETL